MMELMRLRHELIFTMSECQVLKAVYLNQIDRCSLKGTKVDLPDSISFPELEVDDDSETKLINFCDEGPSHHLDIGFDIKEWDPKLLSNVNFRAPDAWKLCITTAGLEEVRAVLRYQLMQKHLLITATRVNQLMMDNCEKAMSELDLLVPNGGVPISVPNSTINIFDCFSKNADQLSIPNIKTVRSKFS